MGQRGSSEPAGKRTRRAGWGSGLLSGGFSRCMTHGQNAGGIALVDMPPGRAPTQYRRRKVSSAQRVQPPVHPLAPPPCLPPRKLHGCGSPLHAAHAHLWCHVVQSAAAAEWDLLIILDGQSKVPLAGQQRRQGTGIVEIQLFAKVDGTPGKVGLIHAVDISTMLVLCS